MKKIFAILFIVTFFTVAACTTVEQPSPPVVQTLQPTLQVQLDPPQTPTADESPIVFITTTPLTENQGIKTYPIDCGIIVDNLTKNIKINYQDYAFEIKRVGFYPEFQRDRSVGQSRAVNNAMFNNGVYISTGQDNRFFTANCIDGKGGIFTSYIDINPGEVYTVSSNYWGSETYYFYDSGHSPDYGVFIELYEDEINQITRIQ